MVAVGCLAERYGAELADSLPEADAVLGFDDYPDIAARLRSIVAGERHHPHTPAGPAPAAADQPRRAPGRSRPSRSRSTGAGSTPARCRRSSWPAAATGAARSARSRRSAARSSAAGRATCWPRRAGSPAEGARELFLVSENSTSYGKDLGDLRLLETLLPELAAVDGVERVRVSYLQPAETRPGLIEAIATTPGVAPYFDLSFQHASPTVLRRMRRFGDPESFLGLLDQVRVARARRRASAPT